MTRSFEIHHTREVHPDTSVPDIHQDTFSKSVLGFWIYLMTDCLLFATLFLAYAVLHTKTMGGPTSKELFSLPLVFAETMILLSSSVTSGFAVLSLVADQKKKAILWLILTFILGSSFVAIEITEFTQLVAEGHSWKNNAFLTSYFSLVGTHGLHVSVGLLWIAVLIGQLITSGITIMTFRRVVIFSLFWHFLDLIWIFIFTFVYLLGVI